MRKRAVFLVTVAILGFAFSPQLANAVTLPIEDTAAAPAGGMLQTAAAAIVSGAEQIVTSIEATIGNVAAVVAERVASVSLADHTVSYTAAAAATVVPNSEAAEVASETTTSSPTTQAPLPPPIAMPVITSAASNPVINVFEVQSALGELAARVQGLSSLLSTQPPSSNVENQIAALQSAISSQGYEASASPPLGGGAPNTIAAANAIDQLSGTDISNPTITGGSITNTSISGGSISGSSLSVSGDTSLSGNLNLTGNFTAGSISFGAASSSNSITTDATSTNLFSTLANFTTAVANTFDASVANIVGFTATNATTTNLAVTGTGYVSGNLGVGTTSASANFAVNGSAYFSNGLTALSATTTNFFASNLTGDVEPFGGNTFSSLSSVLGRVITPADFGALGDTQRKSCTVTTTLGSATLSVTGCSFSSSDVGKYLVVFGAGTASAPLTTTIAGYTSSTQITMGATAQTSIAGVAEEVTWGHDDSAAINAALAAESADGASNTSTCLYLPPAPNGYWGVASPINLDPNGLPSCLRGAGAYQTQVVALTSMPEVLYKDTRFVSGGTVENIGFDGNAVATNTTYLACANRMVFNAVLHANAASNADLVVGDGVTPGCNTDHFNNNDLTNTTSFYTNATLPPYNIVVNTTDSYFNDMECVNASSSNFYTASTSYNTYLTNVHCWGSNQSYYANYTYNINASAHLSDPTVDGVNIAGVLINAVDVDVDGGSLINPASSTATIGVEIAPNLNNVTVTGFDGDQKIAAKNTVVAELPIGTGVHIYANPQGYDYNLMAVVSPVDPTSFSLGANALENLSTTTGSYNDLAFGNGAGLNLSSGVTDILIGTNAGENLTNANSNVAIGYAALKGSKGGGTNSDVAVGYEADGANTSGIDDTFLGSVAGTAVTSGSSNEFIGANAASSTATGSNNIALGYNIDLPAVNGSNQLDIGNLIYGTGVNGSLSTVSSGNVGIGSTTPYSRLEVWGPDTASTSAFTVVNSASTTEFTVYDNGNATLSGNLIQNSDERLKTNISDLDGSSSLAEINALNPVTFNWIDPAKSSVPQFGFIAQQVQQVFPDLVSTTSPTALTPNGTLSLNYIDLISPIVAAIQELDREISSLASTVAGFAQSITSLVGNFGEVNTSELCVQGTCVTGTQLQALLASANQSTGALPVSSSPTTDATDTPAVIQINGDNPAIIQVGASYTDLGATITGPQADLNLGIQTYLNGAPVSSIEIDTSAAATDTIDYVATDVQGLTSTSTRTVIVEPAAVPTASPAPSVDASSTAATSSSA